MPTTDPFHEDPDTAPVPRDEGRAFLVGGGIASLAAASFLIRYGDMRGADITIIDEGALLGGSLDGGGSPESGYSLRGGRMLESKYLCTFDLFASIPTLEGDKTVTEEIFDWNAVMKTSSHSRLFSGGKRHVAPEFGLTGHHIHGLERLAITPEAILDRSTIADQFDADFFKTNFWLMWCTTFAFQPWHSAVEFKRYLLRFAHMVGGFNRLEGIMRTRLNQYDSLVRPLHAWLVARGVRFRMKTVVTDLRLADDEGMTVVRGIRIAEGTKTSEIRVDTDDYVLLTLGSMTEGSSLGSMDAAPDLLGANAGGGWALWEKLADGRPQFGRPAVFTDNVDRSKWVSFTTTLHDATLIALIRDATGNVPGEGGLITFPESSWLASIVIPYQPHFLGQPDDVAVFWGYGLTVDAPGDFVRKPMADCTGREIMIEILGHLGIVAETETILASATCIPCMMPFITSQFMPRGHGDRPDVIPADTANLAVIGQYCELPDDCVFTVEYSVRSAQTAVYALLGLRRSPPAVYKGIFDPRVLFKAFLALHDLAPAGTHGR
ncbi:oleate hydratase [Sphingomonas sp. H160509]|uniref:oleate hydratase n=1 Tax=Sphingomonas sp. H160509 TaxID=2955313 RepID=UPI002096F047|nr:oleate hydratase [Sphingomonas sp. H160509]MDD1450234.1 oleate hydratase [Sphingomonas sp. H160509]